MLLSHSLSHSRSVLFVSIHRFAKGFFPESGAHFEVGAGSGLGFTANVPAPLSVGDMEYLAAWERVVAPLAQAFAPDVVFISAGFDCLKGDPLGGMALSPGTYSHSHSLLHSLFR